MKYSGDTGPFRVGVRRLLVSHETRKQLQNRLAETKNVGDEPEMPCRTVTCASPSD